MATQSGALDLKNKNNLLIIAGLVALIVLAIFISSKFALHRDIITLSDTPGITFMKQKAVECKGDYSKLTPEDQAKVEQYSNNHGPMSISMYYQAPQQGK